MRLIIPAFAAVLSLVSASAFADTVTFGPAIIPTITPLTSYTQGAFTVTNSAGQFVYNIAQGNPPEGITGGNVVNGFSTNAVTVTSSAGGFTFTGFDLDDYSNAASYTLTGSYLGSTVFTTTGTAAASGIWNTFTPGDAGFLIDTLVLSFTDNTAHSVYTLDNIVVNSVPEPSSLALIGTGIAGLTTLVRRRFSRS
jgi:hypothetical protein